MTRITLQKLHGQRLVLVALDSSTVGITTTFRESSASPARASKSLRPGFDVAGIVAGDGRDDGLWIPCAMASTLLNEQGWHPDLIELQLAHAERNKVRAAYDRAQRFGERRKMMEA